MNILNWSRKKLNSSIQRKQLRIGSIRKKLLSILSSHYQILIKRYPIDTKAYRKTHYSCLLPTKYSLYSFPLSSNVFPIFVAVVIDGKIL